MKIVYLINNTWFPGGQTRVLANKVNYWVEQGHEVYILTADQFNYPPFYPIDLRVIQIDFAAGYMGTDELPLWEKAKRLLRFTLRHRKLLDKALKKIRPDIVVAMYSKEIYFLPFIQDGSAKVVEVHGGYYTWEYSRPGFLGKLHNWFDRLFLRRFDRFVVLTEEDLPNWPIKRKLSIPNANTFEPQETAKLDNKVVIAVGRYGEQKNFENLLEAWQLVHAKHPDWQLKICGQGLHLLDPTIEALGLQDSVIHFETKEMEKEYMSASICALSSRHEGMPMFLLEAQACGLPIVSYACECGPRDIIVDGETGILIEEKQNAQRLAEGIIKLIEDEPLRKEMGKQARKRSILFTPNAIMQRWEKLFSELIASKTSNH